MPSLPPPPPPPDMPPPETTHYSQLPPPSTAPGFDIRVRARELTLWKKAAIGAFAIVAGIAVVATATVFGLKQSDADPQAVSATSPSDDASPEAGESSDEDNVQEVITEAPDPPQLPEERGECPDEYSEDYWGTTAEYSVRICQDEGGEYLFVIGNDENGFSAVETIEESGVIVADDGSNMYGVFPDEFVVIKGDDDYDVDRQSWESGNMDDLDGKFYGGGSEDSPAGVGNDPNNCAPRSDHCYEDYDG